MKLSFYTILLSCLLACQVGQKQDGQLVKSLDQKTEELITTIYDFNLAFAAADVSQLEKLLTDKYLHTNGSSSPYTKEVWLKYVKSRKEKIDAGSLAVQDYGMSDIQMTFYGETALVNGMVYSKGTEQSIVFDKKFRVTHLWVLEDNQWKRAGFHDGIINSQ